MVIKRDKGTNKASDDKVSGAGESIKSIIKHKKE